MSVHVSLLLYLHARQALEESIADGKSELTKTVEAGHKLEAATGASPSSDLGYTALENRYLALKVLTLAHALTQWLFCTVQ